MWPEKALKVQVTSISFCNLTLLQVLTYISAVLHPRLRLELLYHGLLRLLRFTYRLTGAFSAGLPGVLKPQNPRALVYTTSAGVPQGVAGFSDTVSCASYCVYQRFWRVSWASCSLAAGVIGLGEQLRVEVSRVFSLMLQFRNMLLCLRPLNAETAPFAMKGCLALSKISVNSHRKTHKATRAFFLSWRWQEVN